MKNTKLCLLMVVVLMMICGCSYADTGTSVLNFLIPPDYSDADLDEFTLSIPSVMTLYGEPITISDYVKRIDDADHSSGVECIPLVSAYDAVLKEMNNSILSIPQNTLNLFTVVHDFYNSGKKDYSGSYYQFIVSLKKTPREEYVFFVDALSGDLLAPVMHICLDQ